jgi:hypothetical protein
MDPLAGRRVVVVTRRAGALVALVLSLPVRQRLVARPTLRERRTHSFERLSESHDRPSRLTTFVEKIKEPTGEGGCSFSSKGGSVSRGGHCPKPRALSLLVRAI